MLQFHLMAYVVRAFLITLVDITQNYDTQLSAETINMKHTIPKKATKYATTLEIRRGQVALYE